MAEKAGFGTRLVAGLIGGVILSLATAVLHFLLRRPGNALSTIADVAYSTYFIGNSGQTPGMNVMGIKVIQTDGTKVDYGRAFLRWVGSVISAMVCGLGYLWIAFDADRQAWHDKIASTYVILVR